MENDVVEEKDDETEPIIDDKTEYSAPKTSTFFIIGGIAAAAVGVIAAFVLGKAVSSKKCGWVLPDIIQQYQFEYISNDEGRIKYKPNWEAFKQLNDVHLVGPLEDTYWYHFKRR